MPLPKNRHDEPADVDAGFLEVGRNDRFEVVINHPNLETDENGIGHIVFSPRQARQLAHFLLSQADEAIQEYRKHKDAQEAANMRSGS